MIVNSKLATTTDVRTGRKKALRNTRCSRKTARGPRRRQLIEQPRARAAFKLCRRAVGRMTIPKSREVHPHLVGTLSPPDSLLCCRLSHLRERFDRLAVAGVLLTRPQYGQHFTGRSGGPLVIGESQMFRLDGVTANSTIGALPDASPERLRLAIRECGIAGAAIGLEMRYASAEHLEAITDSCKVADIEHDLALSRLVKDEWEIAAIEARVGVLEEALRAVARSAVDGLTEIEIASRAVSFLSLAAGSMIPFTGNLGSGAACVDPNSRPSMRRVGADETFFVDLYPDLGGYHADLTRCFAVADASESARTVHRVLEEALAAGIATVGGGATARSIDTSVRRIFAQHGLLGFFPHHSGHSLGLFASEPPFLVPADETVIPAGAVLAIEPGLYIPGVGSFRLEVNVLVTDDGCRILGGLPTGLIQCGA